MEEEIETCKIDVVTQQDGKRPHKLQFSDEYCETSEHSGLRENPGGGTSTWKDVRRQIWAANVIYLLYTNGGVTLAFANLMFEELDENTGSWFASIVGLAIPVGSLISGPLMDRFGRKTASIIVAIPCIPAWLVTCFVNVNCYSILFGSRIMIGVAAGLATSNIVYVSEISGKKYRSALVTLSTLYFAFGILLVSVLQTFFTWRQVAAFMSAFFTVAVILVAVGVPESPVWLANFRRNPQEAKRSLRWLNPNQTIFDAEWRELVDSASAKQRHRRRPTDALTSRAVCKPLAILVALLTLQQSSFIYALIIYAIEIFPLVSPQFGAVVKNEAFALLGVARFVANALCCLLSVRTGRRTLLLTSGLGMTVTAILLAAAPAALDARRAHHSLATLYEWCLIALFLLFVVFGSFGVIPIPWSLIVELLPHEARSVGSAAMLCYGYTLMFVSAKILPFTMDALGAGAFFSCVAIVSACLSAFVFVCVPETLGKSFAEIEKYFT